MKPIETFINESTQQQWVAIEVTTEADFYHSKETRSQRVVTYDTYLDLKSGNNKRGYMKVKYVDLLGPVCKTKQRAMEFLTPKNSKPRKSKIDKGDADYIVWAIPMGKLTPKGDTSFGWNIWEQGQENKKNGSISEIYVAKYGGSFCFMWGSEGTLKEMDDIYVVDNDSQRKLSGAPGRVDAVLPASSKEEFVQAFRDEFKEYCSRPHRAFGRIVDGLPWQKFGQIYSIKGVAEEA